MRRSAEIHLSQWLSSGENCTATRPAMGRVAGSNKIDALPMFQAPCAPATTGMLKRGQAITAGFDMRGPCHLAFNLWAQIRTSEGIIRQAHQPPCK